MSKLANHQNSENQGLQGESGRAGLGLAYLAGYSKIYNNMAYPVTISSKGQLVIPAELRTRLGLKKGTRVVCSEENGRLIVAPIERVLDEVQGFLKPRPGEPSAFEESLAERERQRQRERAEK